MPTLFEPPILPVQIVWAFILFCLGGAVGSFLNVIVYRWPAGLSIVRPPSRCPKCETPIRAFDNVPIFGWLWLRGRCRACRAPISPRYPIVELTTALLFLTLGWVEPIREGWNLPRPPVVAGEQAPLDPFVYSETQLWGVFGFHLALLWWLLCESLWDVDGARSMKRLWMPLGLVGLLVPIWFSWLHPITALVAARPEWAPSLPLGGLLDSVVGIVVGAMAASLGAPATGLGPRGLDGRASATIALVMVGAFLGWQTVLPIATIAMGLFLLASLWGRVIAALRRVPFTGCLFVTTWAWMLGWRLIVARWPLLGFQANYWTIGICGGAVTILAAMTWALRSRTPTASSATS